MAALLTSPGPIAPLLSGFGHRLGLVPEAHPTQQLHQPLQVQHQCCQIPLHRILHQPQVPTPPKAVALFGLPEGPLSFGPFPQPRRIVWVGRQAQPGRFIAVLLLGAVGVQPCLPAGRRSRRPRNDRMPGVFSRGGSRGLTRRGELVEGRIRNVLRWTWYLLAMQPCWCVGSVAGILGTPGQRKPFLKGKDGP